MKKLYGIMWAVCSLGSYSWAAVPIEQLEEAITQSRVSRIKCLLHKVGKEQMSEQARTKLLGNLYDTAAELTDKRIDSKSLIGSWRDMAKTIFGTLCFSGGIIGLAVGIQYSTSNDQRIANASYYGRIGSCLLTSLGAYLFYKGVTCSSQQSMIDQATEVEEYIDSVLNNAELLLLETTDSE